MIQRGDINWSLSNLVEKQGGFSTTLSYQDREKLRAIVRKVHMKHYPQEMITNYECDKMIDAIAPETAAYLIRQHLDNGR